MATVDIADDVERAVIGSPVVPQRLALEAGRFDLLLPLEDVDAVEALPPQPAHGATQLRLLVAQDVGAELAVGPRCVALRTDTLGDVEDDGHREHVVLLGQLEDLPARLDLDVGGVDDGEPARLKPLGRNEVQHVVGGIGCLLVVLVVADEPAAEVRRDHLGGEEVLRCEARLP